MGGVADKKKSSLPPLQNGDHLTGVEFERRLVAMRDDVKAELIDGVVYMTPPVGFEHGDPHADLIFWLRSYTLVTPGVKVSDNATLRLDEKSRPQPDVSVRIVPEAGGRVRYDADGILRGTVELVAEVSAS